MLQIDEGQLLLKTTDFKFIRTNEDAVTIRLYELMAGDEEYRFCAGPVVPMENKLPKKKYHGYGSTQEEALQDCLKNIKAVDVESMFEKHPPMLPPSSVGTF
jgi:hypothetical protein